MSNDVSSSKWVSRLVILIFLSLLAWVTYGNLNNVIGMLSYYIVGILAIFPWCIPMGIGIIWGFVDIILFGGNWYNTTLAIAIVPPSWMTVLYYWIISLIGIAINLVVTMYIIQRIRSKPPKPKTNLALVNCNIIDGNKDSKVIKDGVILIKMIVEEGETPGIIEAVGKADEVEIPAGYEKIYLNGQWVLPGLINSHCHLMMNGKPMKAMAVTSLPDEYLQKLFTLIKIPLLRLLLYKMMHKNALTALNAGVTTLRSMGEMPYLGVKLRKSINKGKLLGPRILAAGLGISPTGGHGGFSGIVADSSVEIRKIVRKNLRNDIDCLKIMSTGGVMDAKRLGEAGAPQMTIEEIETACFEAHRGGILVATHCESTKGIEEALAGGCDTIEHGADIPDELVPLFLDNPKTLRGYTAYSTTLMAGMGISTLPPKVTNVSQMSHENGKLVEVGMIKGLQKAYKEGIRICMGTDASVPYSPHYEMWKELKLYLHYVPEMTNQEVIYFATKSSAEIIGVDDVTGSIEVGKSADLQVVAENPLENIETLSDVKQVMIRGHLIENPSFKKIKALEEVPVDKFIEV